MNYKEQSKQHLNKMNKHLGRSNSNKSVSKSTSKLGLQSKSEFHLRTGMKVRSMEEVMEDIKTKRVRSYQKISFSIRKMDQIFKGKLKETTTEVFNPEQGQKMQKKFSFNSRVEKLKTCINFFDAVKLKKSVISHNELIENHHHRLKTEHFEQTKKSKEKADMTESPTSKRTSFYFHGNPTSILTNSKQQNALLNRGKIPGIQFKNDKALAMTDTILQKSLIAKSFSSSFTKNTSSYMHYNELLQKDEDQRIINMYHLRERSQLFDPPKQWQFYNCLKLNHVSLYKTKLRVSCENWVLLDYLQLKYLRGYDPKVQQEMKTATIVFISIVLLEMQRSGVDCDRLKVRINNDLVQKKMQKVQRRDKDFTLAQNTIISLWDLFIGLIYTCNIDLAWHIIHTIGFLYKTYNFYGEEQVEIAEYSSYVFLQKQMNIKEFQRIFLYLCKEKAKRLELNSFTFQRKIMKHRAMKKGKLLIGEAYDSSNLKQENQLQYLLIKGNCIDVSILFMECMGHPSFHSLISNRDTVTTIKIRYQIGFQFWEPRKHDWVHQFGQQKAKGMLILADKNTENPHWGVFCYNSKEDVLLFMNDCKTNMTILDCQLVFKWMRQTFQRFQATIKKQQ